MTKKEERELALYKARCESLDKELNEQLKANISLRKKLGEFDFQGWNESGMDDEIGNNWHVKWSDYIFEWILDRAICNEGKKEEVLLVLEKCFQAGMDYASSGTRKEI